MPKVTEAHLEARREQILDAALSCFARQGFHPTTMQDICAESELSAGAVYRYFDSKEDIIEACAERCQEHNAAVIAQAASIENAGEVLDHLSNHLLTLGQPGAEEGIRLNIQLWAEAMRNERVMAALRRMGHDAFLEVLIEIASRAQAQGTMNPDLDPESVAHTLLSMWHGLELQKGIDPGLDVEKYLAVVKAIFYGDFLRNNGPERGLVGGV